MTRRPQEHSIRLFSGRKRTFCTLGFCHSKCLDHRVYIDCGKIVRLGRCWLAWADQRDRCLSFFGRYWTVRGDPVISLDAFGQYFHHRWSLEHFVVPHRGWMKIDDFNDNSRIEEFIDLRNRWSCSPTAFFWIYRILNGWKKQWKIHIQTKFCSLMFETVDARLRLGFQSRSPEEPQESGTAWFEECSGGSQ